MCAFLETPIRERVKPMRKWKSWSGHGSVNHSPQRSWLLTPSAPSAGAVGLSWCTTALGKGASLGGDTSVKEGQPGTAGGWINPASHTHTHTHTHTKWGGCVCGHRSDSPHTHTHTHSKVRWMCVWTQVRQSWSWRQAQLYPGEVIWTNSVGWWLEVRRV